MESTKIDSALLKMTVPAFEEIAASASATVTSVSEWDSVAKSAQAKADALRENLTANAQVIAAACMTRGTQAAIARAIVGDDASSTAQNTATKLVGRIASVGRLMVAHPKADVLALYTFVNGATKAEIEEACTAKADPTQAPKKPSKPRKKKAPEGPKKVRDLVEALSQTLKSITDNAIEYGTKGDQEQLARVIEANAKRIAAALAGGVHGDGMVPAPKPEEKKAA